MQINILLFGQLTDITGKSELMVENVHDTNSLKNLLHQQFPRLAESKYIIAVDKIIISENTLLSNHCTVAFLPPFSGG